MSTSNFVGRVYYYASNWLRQIGGRQPEPHYTPIVLEYGKHNVFIVIISSYKIEKETLYNRDKDSYVVIEKDEYSELKKKSIIHCKPYPEQLTMFEPADRKSDLSKVLLEKIIKGIKSNNNNQGWIQDSFKNA